MAVLRFCFLGRVEIYLNDQPIHQTLPDKAVALLCYLAMTRVPHSRGTLAELLWGNKPEDRARNNLSNTLIKLGEVGNYLQKKRKTVGLEPSADIEVDVHIFEQGASRLDERSLGEMMHAAACYRTMLLTDFNLSDEDGAWTFLAWQRTQQSRIDQMAMQLFHAVAIKQLEANNIDAAIEAAKRELALNPLREEAHRQLMRLYYHAGQRDNAIQQFQDCQTMVQEELGREVSAETQQLYEQILADNVPPIATLSLIPFEAPSLPKHFVGRNTLANNIQKQISTANTSVCALVGMGGIGKTTLATFLANQWREDYPDGVIWAHAEDDDLLHIFERWGSLFGRDLSHIKKLENRATALRNVLVEKRILVILDNVQQGSEGVRALIPSEGNSLVVVTTRQHDIASALDALILPIEVLAREDSVSLLREIVGGPRISAELSTAHTICEQLEDLPLALEIVAQRLRSRPHYQLAALEAQLTLAQSRLPTLKVGDRAVRVSFEASWAMLTESLQSAFCGLAVFEGRSFSAEAFAAIINTPLPIAHAQLADLAALSLLTPIDGARYRQHALLADFAFEKTNSLATHQQRFVTYFGAFAKQHVDASPTLQLEWLNLQAAIHYAHNSANWSKTLEITTTLTPIFPKLGHYNDARRLFPLAKTAAEHLDNQIGQAYILHNWGVSCIEQNDYENALPLLEAAFKLAKNDQLLHSDIMLDLARVGIERAMYEEAQQWLMDALTIKEVLKDEVGIGITYYRYGLLYFRNRDLDSAEYYYKLALNLQTKIDPSSLVKTLSSLTQLASYQREFKKATQLVSKTLALARKLNNADRLASVLYQALSIAVRIRDRQLAEKYAAEAIPLFEQLGSTLFVALGHYELSIAQDNDGQYTLALASIRQARIALEIIEDSYNLIFILLHQGDVWLHLEDYDRAKSIWEQGLDMARQVRHPETQRLVERLNSI